MRVQKHNSHCERLILGTVQLGLSYGINNKKGKPSEIDALEMLKFARASGIATLDTAQAYGTAIDIIGKYNKSNNPFRVITKISYSEDLKVEDYVISLIDKLHIDRLESVLLHKFSDLTLHSGFLDAMADLKRKGLIRAIGVSVYTNDELKFCTGLSQIDLIQFPFNLLDNYYLRSDAIQTAADRNKVMHVRSVFLQGLFFMDRESMPGHLKQLKPYLCELDKIAKANRISMAELAFKYVFQNYPFGGILIGVDSMEQLKVNISLLEGDPLDQSVIDQVNAIHVGSPDLLNPVNWK